MKPQRLMRELRASLPRNTMIFGDMGNTYSWILRYFQAYYEVMNFLPSGMACMGSSVVVCIGGKLGKPGSPVVCICGDGDFLMTGMEVLTAVDFVAIARSFGAKGYRIEDPSDVGNRVKKALEDNKPAIIEVIIDPEEKFPLSRRFLVLKDSVGLPKVMKSISKESIMALIKMFKNREV